jgi:hypothetical protein
MVLVMIKLLKALGNFIFSIMVLVTSLIGLAAIIRMNSIDPSWLRIHFGNEFRT